MKRYLTLVLTAALALACLAAPMTAQAMAQAAVQAPAQDKPMDMKKLLAEIIGEYEFALGENILIIQFTEVDGKLFGAPPGETPEEIHPIEGKPLSFDVTLAQSGQYYELQFVRNDKGVIDKCVMNGGGMIIEGAKIIK